MTSMPSLWEAIPQVIFDQILMFVGDIDICGYIALVSRSHRPSELVFKFYCKYIFSLQIPYPKFDVSKWGSWRSMAINRPRLRLNGFYSFRFIFTKAHCNDAFWEPKSHQSIEVTYYRHIRFLEGGRLLYCLDILSPGKIAPWLAGRDLKRGDQPKIYVGEYSLTRNEISITIPMLNGRSMKFKALLSDNYDGAGKHNSLQLIEHYSIFIGDQGNEYRVCYPIPSYNTFYFYRCWDYAYQAISNLETEKNKTSDSI